MDKNPCDNSCCIIGHGGAEIQMSKFLPFLMQKSFGYPIFTEEYPGSIGTTVQEVVENRIAKSL